LVLTKDKVEKLQIFNSTFFEIPSKPSQSR
jgi:hypothetical protein